MTGFVVRLRESVLTEAPGRSRVLVEANVPSVLVPGIWGEYPRPNRHKLLLVPPYLKCTVHALTGIVIWLRVHVLS